MIEKFNTSKIEEVIKSKFNIIYEYKFDGLVLLYGGAVRDITMNEKIHDFDFVILSQKKCQIKDFINKYNLKYRLNIFGGYKIQYNDIEVDMFTTDDLLDCVAYNVDLLFYDLDKKILIPCGPLYAYKERKIKEVNDHELVLLSHNKRIKKLIKFVKYMTDDDSKVKIKVNRLLSEYRYSLRKIKYKIDHIKNLWKSNYAKCLKYLYNCKTLFILASILTLLISAISAITPVVISKLLIEVFIKSNNIINAVIILLFLNILSLILSFISSKMHIKIKESMLLNIRKDIFKNIEDLEIKNDCGNDTLLNGITNASNKMAITFNRFNDFLIKMFVNILVIAYISFLNYKIAIVFILLLAILNHEKSKDIRKKNRLKKKEYLEQDKNYGILSEILLNKKDIQSFGIRENSFLSSLNRCKNINETNYEEEYRNSNYINMINLLQFLIICIFLVIVFLFIKSKELSAFSCIVILIYFIKSFNCLEKKGLFEDIRLNFNLSCLKIFNILENNYYEDCKAKRLKGSIEFINVCARHDNKSLLKNYSFKIKENTIETIVEKSKEKRMIIYNLITKESTSSDGKILIDNKDINKLSKKDINNNISIILSNPFFFNMSIKDNLKLVDKNITDQQIEEVCDKVCLKEFIESLPNKYDTSILEGGILLNESQRQRLSLARALIKNNNIIIMDVSSKILDDEYIHSIKKALNNIKKSHTIIIFADSDNIINITK